MKYNTMKEIVEDETLNLKEVIELMQQFLNEKGMDMEEYMATDEGQELLKISEEDRFTHP